MGKHTKRFATQSLYTAFKSSADYLVPNVSVCDDNLGVHYNPWTWTEEYLTFVAKESGTFTFTPKNDNVISYSTDGGSTWTGGNSVEVSNGDKVLWKGTMTPSTSYSQQGIGKFGSTGNFDVQGNAMSLLYGDNYKGQTNLIGKDYAFYDLFKENTKVINAENLSLPATTLTQRCYYNMFYGCTALTTAPKLPAMALATDCYQGMFYGCTALTTAPELPATTLASSCYLSMFVDCSSLITAPELPATTLTDMCYSNMFYGCTNLVNAPELPAMTLTTECYKHMFHNCTSLINAPELPATTLADYCYREMFHNCTSLTTAPELPATTLTSYCYEQMFSGCTSLVNPPELPATTLTSNCYGYMFNDCTNLVNAPALPATTLARYCYNYMFNGCTSLVTAPELPAITLASSCYYRMFYGCTSLNYIKAMFTTTPSSTYTSNWVNGVSSNGTFIKNSAAQWDVTGVHGIPTGWTVQTVSA